MSEESKLVVVTGFGPFRGHETINASWEAVQLLPNSLSNEGTNYELERRKVPVEFAAVDKAVTEIWQREPKLVVHVGVSAEAKCVYVERLAYNHKFIRPDNAGQYLENGTCCLAHHGKANVLRTKLNVDKIVRAVNATCADCVAPYNVDPKKPLDASKASKNVGGFLCGYIYLNSLDVDCKRCLFVHVPPVDKPFSTHQTANILTQIIKQCLQQLEDCDSAQ